MPLDIEVKEALTSELKSLLEARDQKSTDLAPPENEVRGGRHRH